MKFKIFLIVLIIISFNYSQGLKFEVSYPLLSYSPDFQKNFRESLFYGVGINIIILYQLENETYFRVKLKYSGYKGIAYKSNEGDGFINLSAGLKAGKPLFSNFKFEAGLILNGFTDILDDDNNVWSLSGEIIYQKWKNFFIGLENQYFLNSKIFDLKDAVFFEIGLIF